MDENFWHRKWSNNNIGFHQETVNPLLVAHFDALHIAVGARVFVPLCGKTLDIEWLLSRGYRVVGAELSELAIQQLFESLEIVPQITSLDKLKHYHAENIDIFVGNIFDLSGAALGDVDAIFDRAALVALPETVRHAYAQHVTAISQTAPVLLITYDYDQSHMDGPPFALKDAEIRQYYEADYAITLLASEVIAGGLKQTRAKENVWLLTPRG